VFVHDAWADASGFGGVIRALGDRGFTAAIGMANPLRHLTGDAAYLTSLLGTYGGAVMSSAAVRNEHVQALVFCNGWMPDEGESIQQLFESGGPFAGSLAPAAIRPVPFTNPDGSEGVDLWLDRELFPEAFCADVDPDGQGDGGDPTTLERRRVRHAFGPAGVAVDPVVVPGGHRGPSHPAGGTAIHGRAWECTDRGGGGLARVHGVAAGGRDAADPERRRGDNQGPVVVGPDKAE
jgi:hypothetical protein